MHLATHGILARPTAAVSFSNTKSVDFDGVDDYVDLGSFTLNTDAAWSISLWAYLDGFSSTYPGPFILKTDEATGFCCFFNSSSPVYQGINFGSNANFMRIKTTGDISASLVGVWKHVVLTYNGSGKTTESNYTIYVDGSVVASVSSAPFASVENRSNIGRANGSNSFDGNIDEVGIFDSELSSSDVTAIYNSGTPLSLSSYSPLGWWRMGDGDTYPTLTDNGSGGNNGTMTNMVSGDIVTDVP